MPRKILVFDFLEMPHIPVMLKETLDCLAVKPGGLYIDATLGGGSHAAAILELMRGEGRLLGIDRDQAALEQAAKTLGAHAKNVVMVRGNHADLESLALTRGFGEVDGVLIDTGVSSFQLDQAQRGFSFMREGPLDMRMDTSQKTTAADLVNNLTQSELATILRDFGEEPRSRRIATAIVRARDREILGTTTQLAEVVERAVGGRRGRRHHPATRTFQALRMAVNSELASLAAALSGAISRLRPDGRLVVITFESLTDRMVKHRFRDHVGREVSLHEGGSRWEGRQPRMAWVVRRAIKPDATEIFENSRAHSARLRAVRRLSTKEDLKEN